MELIAALANRKPPPLFTDPGFARGLGVRNMAMAEKYNEPGRFTTLIVCRAGWLVAADGRPGDSSESLF
jgi:hypothetical protein